MKLFKHNFEKKYGLSAKAGRGQETETCLKTVASKNSLLLGDVSRISISKRPAMYYNPVQYTYSAKEY
jgi:hypothetical protein